MEAPPTPPLEVAEANFLLEFSVILFDPPLAVATTSWRGVWRARVTSQEPTGSVTPTGHSSSSVCSPSAPSRPTRTRIAAKRPLNSGPLPSRHVTHRHAERGTRAARPRPPPPRGGGPGCAGPPHRQRRVLAPPQTGAPLVQRRPHRRRRAHRRRIVKAQGADTLAERGCRAIDLIGQDDAGRHPRGVRGTDLLQGDCWFALEDDVEGNANLAPALLINRPRLGQVEPRGEGQASGLIGNRQADQDLAVVDLAHLTAILPCHADRVLALLGHAAFVDDPEAQRPASLAGPESASPPAPPHRSTPPRTRSSAASCASCGCAPGQAGRPSAPCSCAPPAAAGRCSSHAKAVSGFGGAALRQGCRDTPRMPPRLRSAGNAHSSPPHGSNRPPAPPSGLSKFG